MTTLNFDEIIDRCGTHSMKWDEMEARYGVSAQNGLSMWVADMDFRPPKCVSAALAKMQHDGIFGYYGNDESYRQAICSWMQTRHKWVVNPDHIFTTHGLVNGTALCVHAFTQPNDGVVLFTPVYHAFARVVKAAGRQVVECPLVEENGHYTYDFDHYDTLMSGHERLLMLCSPHNPNGRVWTLEELEGVAAFAQRHDLIIVSDEIHHDLVYPGHTHTPMTALSGIEDRLVMMTAPTKTFNIAGCHTGNVIIKDAKLRATFASLMNGLGMSANSFGLIMTEAAYSPEGAAWVDALMLYLDGNRKIFDAGIAEIPGLRSIPLQSTYLSWVDFSGTGMARSDFTARVEKDAKIAANHGPTFGTGGETFLRFNIATPRVRVVEAVKRLQAAFSDLQ